MSLPRGRSVRRDRQWASALTDHFPSADHPPVTVVTVRFGVLGPLAVWTDSGAPVVVPGAKVRALLADLLVHRGNLVTADRLVEDLWGADAPRRPLGALPCWTSHRRTAALPPQASSA